MPSTKVSDSLISSLTSSSDSITSLSTISPLEVSFTKLTDLEASLVSIYKATSKVILSKLALRLLLYLVAC